MSSLVDHVLFLSPAVYLSGHWWEWAVELPAAAARVGEVGGGGETHIHHHRHSWKGDLSFLLKQLKIEMLIFLKCYKSSEASHHALKPKASGIQEQIEAQIVRAARKVSGASPYWELWGDIWRVEEKVRISLCEWIVPRPNTRRKGFVTQAPICGLTSEFETNDQWTFVELCILIEIMW